MGLQAPEMTLHIQTFGASYATATSAAYPVHSSCRITSLLADAHAIRHTLPCRPGLMPALLSWRKGRYHYLTRQGGMLIPAVQ